MQFPKNPRIKNPKVLKQYAIDHPYCEIPNCNEPPYMGPHHIKYRSEGGSDVEENLIELCFGHHTKGHQNKRLWKKIFLNIKKKNENN